MNLTKTLSKYRLGFGTPALMAVISILGSVLLWASSANAISYEVSLSNSQAHEAATVTSTIRRNPGEPGIGSGIKALFPVGWKVNNPADVDFCEAQFGNCEGVTPVGEASLKGYLDPKDPNSYREGEGNVYVLSGRLEDPNKVKLRIDLFLFSFSGGASVVDGELVGVGDRQRAGGTPINLDVRLVDGRIEATFNALPQFDRADIRKFVLDIEQIVRNSAHSGNYTFDLIPRGQRAIPSIVNVNGPDEDDFRENILLGSIADSYKPSLTVEVGRGANPDVKYSIGGNANNTAVGFSSTQALNLALSTGDALDVDLANADVGDSIGTAKVFAWAGLDEDVHEGTVERTENGADIVIPLPADQDGLSKIMQDGANEVRLKGNFVSTQAGNREFRWLKFAAMPTAYELRGLEFTLTGVAESDGCSPSQDRTGALVVKPYAFAAQFQSDRGPKPTVYADALCEAGQQSTVPSASKVFGPLTADLKAVVKNTSTTKTVGVPSTQAPAGKSKSLNTSKQAKASCKRLKTKRGRKRCKRVATK